MELLASHVTEEYEKHVIDYIVEDHNIQYHMIIEDYMKDYFELTK